MASSEWKHENKPKRPQGLSSLPRPFWELPCLSRGAMAGLAGATCAVGRRAFTGTGHLGLDGDPVAAQPQEDMRYSGRASAVQRGGSTVCG